ncbi:hypothetical protein [Sporisorium scitamineum]|uniref:Uncharacterized protein n=1 Tax=Sporisorium scitamineum TaxID=49012 RepID=A0A0F7S0D3_9BASI|nr:hypothetical protein [Sporisorium scitamineum]
MELRRPPAMYSDLTLRFYQEVASASFNTMSDVANAHSDVLHSHSLASFLHP